MKNAMEYKGYIGSAEYSDDEGVFFALHYRPFFMRAFTVDSEI